MSFCRIHLQIPIETPFRRFLWPKGKIDEPFVSIKRLSRFYVVDVPIDEMDIEAEYRSFCLVYHQAYGETGH